MWRAGDDLASAEVPWWLCFAFASFLSFFQNGMVLVLFVSS
jgi:hypothetical protein